jgi:hypothetical protein
MHAEPSHWLHEIFNPKTVSAHFLGGLISPLETWGTHFHLIDCCGPNLGSSSELGTYKSVVGRPPSLSHLERNLQRYRKKLLTRYV